MSDIPDVNGIPVFVPAFNDNIRIGSFVHVKNTQFGQPFLSLPPNNPTSIGRLTRVVQWTPKVQVEILVFPFMVYGPPSSHKLPQNHPSLPKHQFSRLMDGTGSQNDELYQSSFFIMVSTEDIIQVAFVFSLNLLCCGNNRWGNGVKNVFFVRFKEVKNDAEEINQLVPIKSYIGPPTDHPDTHVNVSQSFPPQCMVQVVWRGLFVICQAIVKILNKNSGQSEPLEVDTCSIGMISPKIWMYLTIFCQDKITTQQFICKESYLDIDHNFTRKKFGRRPQGTLFASKHKRTLLSYAIYLLGFGSTYGSLKKRPTLCDSKKGVILVILKPRHHLSVVRGIAEGEDDPIKF